MAKVSLEEERSEAVEDGKTMAESGRQWYSLNGNKMFWPCLLIGTSFCSNADDPAVHLSCWARVKSFLFSACLACDQVPTSHF